MEKKFCFILVKYNVISLYKPILLNLSSQLEKKDKTSNLHDENNGT